MSPEKPGYIEKPDESPLSFDALRKEGISLLQQYSGKLWTDYNLHDPGVTILEQLCFAITDVAYRGNFSIEDLLTEHDGKIDNEKNGYFDRRLILSSEPVTINDYRKIIIDEFKDVENAWIEPVIDRTGAATEHYRVVVKMTRRAIDGNTGDQNDELKIAILDRLNRARNLCESFAGVEFLSAQKIRIQATIEIKEPDKAADTLADIFRHVDRLFSRQVNFYSEHDLLLKGMKPAEIYAGPLLRNGIIPDYELYPRKTRIDSSDITEAIFRVANVIAVKSVYISNGDAGKRYKMCECGPDKFLQLDEDLFDEEIILTTGGNRVKVNPHLFNHYLVKNDHAGEMIKMTGGHLALAPVAKRKYRNIARYNSLQHFFPPVYGIGAEGLEKNATEQRKAEAKQLKAYLMLFEQMLANHLAQLAHISDLYDAGPESVRQTLFWQPLHNVPGAEAIIKKFTDIAGHTALNEKDKKEEWDTFIKDPENAYARSVGAKVESKPEYFRRKNRILDHLLARHNEVLSDHPVRLFSELYAACCSETMDEAILSYKANYFNHLDQLSCRQELSGGTPGMENGYSSTKAGNNEPVEIAHSRLMLKIMLLLNIQRYKPETDRPAATPQYKLQPVGSSYFYADRNDARKLTSNITVTSDGTTKNYTVAAWPGEKISSQVKFPGHNISFFKEVMNEDIYRLKATATFSREQALAKRKRVIQWFTQFNINSEGFHLVEHNLLAPQVLADSHPVIDDFAGLKVTIVLPQWPSRFQNPDFKKFVVETFVLNMPAHIQLYFKWLNIPAMYEFEALFFNLTLPGTSPPDKEAVLRLIKLLAHADPAAPVK